MPARPAMMALSIQFTSATRSGDTPLTNAPVWDSAAARVTSPNRVYRSAAANTTAKPTTVIARKNRSANTATDPSSHRSVGKIAVTLTGLVPCRIASTPCKTTSTPSDATALAKGGASRSGRNTNAYNNAPSAAATIKEIATAGAKPSSAPTSIVLGSPGTGMSSSPRRSPAYVYATYRAIAPVAKFTTPDAR